MKPQSIKTIKKLLKASGNEQVIKELDFFLDDYKKTQRKLERQHQTDENFEFCNAYILK